MYLVIVDCVAHVWDIFVGVLSNQMMT